MMSRWLVGLGAVVLLCVAFTNGAARAQVSMEIPESLLMSPWEQHLTVLQSLENTILGLENENTKAAVFDAFFFLESGISEYEAQVDDVIYRLAGDPQFAYQAGEVSAAMADVLDRVYTQFENLYETLGVDQREDVLNAQQSLDELRSVLKRKRPFENEVLNALGSGIPQIIIGLAERWWHGEEKAILTKEYIAALRPKLE
jgi:hypothetical protein